MFNRDYSIIRDELGLIEYNIALTKVNFHLKLVTG